MQVYDSHSIFGRGRSPVIERTRMAMTPWLNKYLGSCATARITAPGTWGMATNPIALECPIDRVRPLQSTSTAIVSDLLQIGDEPIKDCLCSFCTKLVFIIQQVVSQHLYEGLIDLGAQLGGHGEMRGSSLRAIPHDGTRSLQRYPRATVQSYWADNQPNSGGS